MEIKSFVEENLNKVDITIFNENQGQYNNWTGFIWNLKSLGVDPFIVKAWAKGGNNYDENSFNTIWNRKDKGNDDINIALKNFEKYSGIKYKKEIDINEFISKLPKETNIAGKKYLNYLDYKEYKMPNEFSFKQFEENFSSMYNNDYLIMLLNGCRKADNNWNNNLLTVSEVLQGIKDLYINKQSFEQGVTFKCNTFNKKKVLETNFAGDENLNSYKFCLIEVDSFDGAEVPIEIQYNFIKSLKIPYSMITFSGKKSLHVLVPLNAKNKKEYEERQKLLYNICNANGLKIDPACKNPGRETRLPFTFRNNVEQKLIDIKANSEFKSFLEWYNYFASQYILENSWNDSKRFKIREICNSDLIDIFYYEGQHYYELKSMQGMFQRVDRLRLLDEIKKHLKDSDALTELLNQYGKKHLTLDMIDIPNKKPQFIITLDEVDGVKNLYKPGFIKEIYENPKPFITTCPSEWDKLLDNLAGKEEREWLINHLSCYFNTFKNTETIPVFIGAQGTGKDTFAEAIGKCIGMFLTEDSAVLTDRFNDYLLHGCILFNEASISAKETRTISNKLKLLTNQTISIEMKGKARFETINNSYKMIASNDDNIGAAIKIEDGDRRYCFISGGKNVNALKNNITDYKLLIEQTMDFCYYIKNYKYDEFKARVPLNNNIKEEQFLSGLSDLENALRDFINNSEQKDTLILDDIFNYLNENGFKNFTSISISKYMKKLGYLPKQIRIKKGDSELFKFGKNKITKYIKEK